MSVLNLAITTSRPDTYLVSTFEAVGGNRAIAERIKQYLERVATGSESALSSGNPPGIAVSVQGSAVRASATLTCVSVIATDTVVINGVTFTAVDSAPSTNQFVRAASNTTTATNLAAAINASATALVAGYVTATSAVGVVTVYSAFYSTAGNQTTLTTAGGTITASSSRLISGAADAAALNLTF